MLLLSVAANVYTNTPPLLMNYTPHLLSCSSIALQTPASMIDDGDFNPIHISPYFSDYASLPGTITHGMWSSAATRKYVENAIPIEFLRKFLQIISVAAFSLFLSQMRCYFRWNGTAR